jgi:hypothetical protein
MLNEIRELAEQKDVTHRDFYNVRKVRREQIVLILSLDASGCRWTPTSMPPRQ